MTSIQSSAFRAAYQPRFSGVSRILNSASGTASIDTRHNRVVSEVGSIISPTNALTLAADAIKRAEESRKPVELVGSLVRTLGDYDSPFDISVRVTDISRQDDVATEFLRQAFVKYPNLLNKPIQ